MTHKFFLAMMALGVLLLLHGIAAAQFNNRPYAFRSTPDGGLGMSRGGRQAIMNDKLFGLRPKDIARDQNGFLMDIQKGPGDIALRRNPVTGEIMPPVYGGLFTHNFMMPSTGYAFYASDTQGLSSDAINEWTSSVNELKK